jgi:hypothetical protein
MEYYFESYIRTLLSSYFHEVNEESVQVNLLSLLFFFLLFFLDRFFEWKDSVCQFGNIVVFLRCVSLFLCL